MALLLGTVGCASWRIPVQVVDATTSQPIDGVNATWITAHRRFLDYTRSTEEFQFGPDGKLTLERLKNKHPYNIIIFEHPKYHDAALGVIQVEGGIQLRLTSPAPVSNLPWLRTKSQVVRRDERISPTIVSNFTNALNIQVPMFVR